MTSGLHVRHRRMIGAEGKEWKLIETAAHKNGETVGNFVIKAAVKAAEKMKGKK